MFRLTTAEATESKAATWVTRSAPWLAALAYGGWAAFSNWEYGELNIWLTAGLVQGTFAFVATLLLTRLVLFLRSWREGRLSAVAVFCCCSTVLLAVPTLLQWLAGTPDIIQSILPGAIIGHLYLLYVVCVPEVLD